MSHLYDLHAHSRASDGTLTATGLVERAAANGVDVLALTDHDTIDGIAEARAAADMAGIRLIPGVEVSVTWQRQTIHIVGLNVDPNNTELQVGLTGLQSFRDWRAEEIGRRLEQAGIMDTYSEARALARGRIVSRTHFAHVLVARGHAKDVRQVFKRFLVKNKPGYVSGQWTSLEDCVRWIRAAGGQAVVAHPARYGLTATKLKRLLGEFKEHGGVGMEVVSGSHSRDDVARMAAIARTMDMLASSGSDYHGPENPWTDLGRLEALPSGLTPVWQDWPEQAA